MQAFRLVKSLLLPTRIFAITIIGTLTPPSPIVAPATGNVANTEAANKESSNGPTPTPPSLLTPTPTRDGMSPIVGNLGVATGQANIGEDRPSGGPRGIDGLDNGCYMNSVLQIIAALYADKVQGSPLEEIDQKINNSEGEAVKQADVQSFVDKLPEGDAKKMANSGRQEDTSEFILLLNVGCPFLESYESIMENFYKLHDDLLYHEKVNNPEVHPMLIIEFDQSIVGNLTR